MKIFMPCFLGVCLLLTVFLAGQAVLAAEQQYTGKPLGKLMADLPSLVEINQTFDIDIWFEPADPRSVAPVTVSMVPTADINYETRVFQINPLKKKTVRAKVVKSVSGLMVIRATSLGCASLEKALNVGFPLKLASPQLDKPIESGSIRYFTLDFSDNMGKSVPLGSTVNFLVKVYKGEFLTASREWGNMITFDMER